MKPVLLYFSFFICSFSCFAQRDSILQYTSGRDSIRFIRKGAQLAEQITYYKSGRIASDESYDREGELVSYATFYENGKKSGLWIRHKKCYTWDTLGRRKRVYSPKF